MTKLLIVVVLVLGLLAIAQLARVAELTSKLRGKREEDIPHSDNLMNARLMWVFLVAYFAFFIWLMVAYRDKMLPVAASEHGVALDKLLDFNWIIIIVVFFITNIALFFFAGKYIHDPQRKAYYYPHNNKLELIWTIVPAIVLAVIIIYGLRTWNTITEPASADAMKVELYAKQFDWTARYAGKDNVLGATDFRLINGTNPLGIVTETTIVTRLAELQTDIDENMATLDNAILPDSKVDEIKDHIEHVRRMRERIINLRTMMQEDIKEKGEASPYLHGSDDIVTKEFHLPLREEVNLLIRSRDVIHSAYMPHLRAQMNAVPGMTTTIKMTPTITTDSMRLVMNDKDFNYILLCNKICGASHYNMQMALVIDPASDFKVWMAEQQKKPFEGAEETPEAAPTGTVPDTTAVNAASIPDEVALMNN